MSTKRRDTSIISRRSALLAALLLAMPLAATAQSAPAQASSTAPAAMDHAGMHGMTMPAATGAVARPAAKAPAGKAKKPRATATSAPASAGSHAMDGMDHAAMDHAAMPPMDHAAMDHDAMPPMDHAAMDHAAMPSMDHAAMDHGAMSSMDHAAMDHGAAPAASGHGMPGMDHQAMPGMRHGADTATGMSMGPMQGGRAPVDARSGDYSDGIAATPAQRLHAHGSAPTGMLLVDRLEAFHGHGGNGQSWEAEGWYGSDVDKLWLRSEGERSGGRLEDGEAEVLWNHAVAPFWGTQLGVRHDFGAGPRRDWAAFGVQGLAPYWFELEATAYVGPAGRTAARLRADYELLFTQRLILQPELEVNLHGKSDPARGIGSGLTDARLGLRLRYEIRREFAPYLGVVWTRRFGTTADFARADHQAVFDRQWVAGLRIWF